MPALPPVSHVVRVDFHESVVGGAPMQNREFFQYTGALSQSDAQVWVDAIADKWIANILAAQTTQVSLVSTTLTDLTSTSSPQAVSSHTGVGTVGGAVLGQATAVVIKKKTARRYRGGHPRIYLGGLVNPDISDINTWSAAFIANLVAAYNLFISQSLNAVPVAAAPATQVNVSYFQGFHLVTPPSGRTHAVPTLRPGGPVVDTIISHAVNPQMASQRRRNQQST